MEIGSCTDERVVGAATLPAERRVLRLYRPIP
jgi:hypothetical protein